MYLMYLMYIYIYTHIIYVYDIHKQQKLMLKLSTSPSSWFPFAGQLLSDPQGSPSPLQPGSSGSSFPGIFHMDVHNMFCLNKKR